MTKSVQITSGNGFVARAIVTAVKAKHPSWNITVLDLRPEGAERS